MSQKNYVNVHVLISHSPSCLNRDDMNMQKTAIFGGVRRVRVSSQSLKRAIRMSPYYEQNLGKPSVRTRNLSRLLGHFEKALNGEVARDLLEKTLQVLAGKDGLPDDAEADAVAPWSVAEIRKAASYVKSKVDKGEYEKLLKLAVESKQDKREYQELRQEMKGLLSSLDRSMDIALSGRMATSGLMTSVDGAMALAHTLTTHAVDSDIDWFTAVDDLTVDAGETGAGHLNTQEMSSGVFYRYASLNLRQLQENLGAASRERVLEIAGHLAHLLATVVPEAKRQSTAADNPADFVLASFADQPLSLANAFEEAITSRNGFLKPSVEALTSYWRTMNEAYGLNETVAGFSPRFPVGEGVMAFKKLDELKKWIARDGKSA